MAEFNIGRMRVEVNRPELVGRMADIITNFNKENDDFHEKMMQRGVKAYRCNDGWVNRQRFHVTFFPSEREKGYYWGNLNMEVGDMIFIGNAHDGGRFAKITGRVDEWQCSCTYSFEPLEETMAGTHGLNHPLCLNLNLET